MKMRNEIRYSEKMAPGCWEVSTRTEDGHRISGFGCTRKQAVNDAYQKAKGYGDYEYPGK